MTPYEEGRAAAEAHKGFDACPHTFHKFGGSADEFNATRRADMDEWFRGWKGWLDEHGLQFDFKPRGSGRRWTTARRAAAL